MPTPTVTATPTFGTPVYSPPPAVNDSQSKNIQSELSQLAVQYNTTKDAALSAKISTIIYKNCKEAVSEVRSNPMVAISIVTQISTFLSSYYRYLPMDMQTKSSLETTARALQQVISLVPYTANLQQLTQSCNIWGSSLSWCQDAQQILQEKRDSFQSGRTSYQHLIS